MDLFTIISYVGLIACGIQGSEKSCHMHKLYCFPASCIASLGGGMFRDLFILCVFPLALTVKHLPDITIALCAGIFYRNYLRKNFSQDIIKPLVILADGLALGTFISLGVDQALSLGASQPIAFCCGVITALGGGVLSSLLCGQSAYNVLTSSFIYRIITIIGTFLYMCLLIHRVSQATAQYWLILYTFFLIPISNDNFRIALKNIFAYSLMLVSSIPMVFILYQPVVCGQCILPYSLHTSDCCRNRNIPYLSHTATLLNYKAQCPRRFSRGR